MNPVDFLTLAKELSAGRREVGQRSAVSRAYYAAFHAALAMASQCGIRFGKSSSAHDKVAICLQHAASDELPIAGSHLIALRSARNEADYDLKSQSFTYAKFAELRIRMADEIIAAAHGKQADEQIRTAIRKYAQDILGLSVAD